MTSRLSTSPAPLGVKRWWLRVVVALVAMALALPTAGMSSAAAAETPYDAPMSSAQKRERALTVLEAWVPHAESFWCDNGDVGGLCNPNLEVPALSDGYFVANGPGVSQIRGEGEIAFIYATLLAERPAQESFGGVPRATVFAHAREAIGHVLHTNTLVYSGGDPLEWGGVSEWQGSMMTYNATWAGQLLWNSLPKSTKNIVNTIVKHEANIHAFEKTPRSMSSGDTRAEDNAWNTGILAAAAAMLPGDANNAAWVEAAKNFAVNALTKESDATNGELIDGRPMSEWKSTTNINEDLTLFNHSFFHPTYLQGLYQSFSDSANFFAGADAPLPQPEAFTYRLAEVWDGVLGPLMSGDGDIIHPVGTDWTRHDYQHLTTLSVVSTRLQRADAAVYESRGLELLAARQAATGSGSLFGQPRLGYEADVARNVAGLYWTHKFFDDAPTPDQGEFEAAVAEHRGIQVLPDARALTNTQASGTVAVSWDSRGSSSPAVQIVPSSEGHLDDPLLMAALPKSGFHALPGNGGTVPSYSCDCRADEGFMSTAGTSVNGANSRYLSVSSFKDGTVLLLDRGVGSGTVGHAFNWGFETIPGATGERKVWTAGGELNPVPEYVKGALPPPPPGNWMNVADRFGLLVAGGANLAAYYTPPETGASTRMNSNIEIEGSEGAGTGYRVAAVLQNATHGQTQELSAHIRKLTVPDHWAAVTARALDGTEKLAIGRWAGVGSAQVGVTSDRGAPIFDRPTVVDGDRGVLDYELDAVASTGATATYYVASSSGRPVTATLLSDGRVEILNEGAQDSTVTVNWVDAGGAVRTASTLLGAGQTGYATGSDGAVLIDVPASEPIATGVAATGSTVVEGTAWSVPVTVTPSTATGTVQILHGDVVIGTATVNNGSATAGVNGEALQRGTYTLSVRYLGDEEHAASSSTFQVTVEQRQQQTQPVATTTNLTVPPMTYGSPGSATITVASESPMTGMVQLRNGGTVIGTARVGAGGSALITIPGTALEVGTHTLIASYLGSEDHESSQGSTQVTVAKAASTTDLVLSWPRIVVGKDKVIVTAPVTATGVNPTGSVVFRAAGTALGTAPIVGGTARLTISPAPKVGPLAITATYAGDDHVTGGTSAAVTLQVVKATPKVTAKVTAKKVVAKKTKATLTVRATAPGIAVHGKVKVTWRDKTRTVTLNQGKATVVNLGKWPKKGTKTIKIRYQGSDLAKAVTTTVQVKVHKNNSAPRT